MLKHSLSFSSIWVDLVDADLLVPGCDRKMVGDWRERDMRDAILWWVVQSNIFAEVAESVGGAR